MATTTAFAYVTTDIPTFNGLGPPTSFDLPFSGVVGDGVQTPVGFAACYTWDTTQSVATNYANLKANVVVIGTESGFNLSVSGVLVFSAVT